MIIKLALLLGLLTGCKFLQTQDFRTSRGASTDVVISSTLSFSRDKARTTGTLKFDTTLLIQCEIDYWYAKEQPKTQPCGTEEPKSNFGVQITGLNPDSPYELRIFYWLPGQSRSEARFVDLKEDSDGGVTGQFESSMFVLRASPNMGSGMLHEHPLDNTLASEDLKKQLNFATGCTAGEKTPPSMEPRFTSTKPTGISSFSFDGINEASPLDQEQLRFKIRFPFFSGGGMRVNYQRNDGQREALLPEFATFKSLGLSDVDGEKEVFVDNLFQAPQILKRRAKQSLKLRWQAENLGFKAYVVSRFEDVKHNKLGSCTFIADTNTAEIPGSFLDSLNANSIFVNVVLVSFNSYFAQSKNDVGWLLHSHDWRAVNIKNI